ncbi:glycosyltransferase [Patescibacteria group bacterium]|nr:glycosyltransferase [Patescibacteria group bacterium]
MKPELSIIIVSFNTEKLTRECIESILKNSSGVNYEILVVDNDSKDDSVSMLREYQSTLSNFKLLENRQNLGFARANNQGIKVAKGKYILLLNSDTKVKAKALGTLMHFAEKTQDAGVIGAKLLNPDGSIQASCYNFPAICGAIKEYWLGQKGAYEKYSPEGTNPRTVDIAVATAFLITPLGLKKVGLLDERYFFYLEDFDYCRRVWKSGLKVYFLPDAEIVHYLGASGKKVADRKNQWRRLIPGSKIYHGPIKYYILFIIIWLSQKWQKIFGG